MMLEARTRGQPLLALVLVLASWVGARTFAWENALKEAAGQPGSAAAPDRQPAVLAHLAAPARAPTSTPTSTPTPTPPPTLARSASRTPGFSFAPPVRIEEPAPLPARAAGLLAPIPAPVMAPLPAAVPDVAAPPPAPARAAVPAQQMYAAAGHQSMWLAATALMPLPPLGIRTPAPAIPQAAQAARRWSGDGWLLLRRNPAGVITPGPLPGTYGASQVGAVIRYRLDTASANRPSAYLRAAAALGHVREQEAALGLSARPLGGIPLVAMAEARLSRSGSAVRVRPAVALVTELPPQALPLGFTAEAYAQGGYIGGRKPTGFVDGLVRVERPLPGPADTFHLKAGVGAWAAKQRGASRVDLGPVASVTFRLTDTASARVEADWRFRVGGRSRPDSGPALTISTGF